MFILIKHDVIYRYLKCVNRQTLQPIMEVCIQLMREMQNCQSHFFFFLQMHYITALLGRCAVWIKEAIAEVIEYSKSGFGLSDALDSHECPFMLFGLL